MSVDSGLKDLAKVPQIHSRNITPTKPDITRWQQEQCIIWELSVSWEEFISQENERKKFKYQELAK